MTFYLSVREEFEGKETRGLRGFHSLIVDEVIIITINIDSLCPSCYLSIYLYIIISILYILIIYVCINLTCEICFPSYIKKMINKCSDSSLEVLHPANLGNYDRPTDKQNQHTNGPTNRRTGVAFKLRLSQTVRISG